MDENSLDEKKNYFLEHINDALDSAFAANTITETEMQKCAAFILDEMGLMKNDDDMLDLIKRVNIKWTIFDSVITLLSKKEFIEEDKEAMDKVKDMLASFNSQA
jgi:predicted transcriptional regulator